VTFGAAPESGRDPPRELRCPGRELPESVTGLTDAGLPFEGVKGWILQEDGRQVAFMGFISNEPDRYRAE